jgi:hypothetical protein
LALLKIQNIPDDAELSCMKQARTAGDNPSKSVIGPEKHDRNSLLDHAVSDRLGLGDAGLGHQRTTIKARDALHTQSTGLKHGEGI